MADANSKPENAGETGGSKSSTPAPTSKPGSGKGGNKSGSKPSSAKSVAGSVKSSGSGKSAEKKGTPSSPKTPAKPKKGKKEIKEKPVETPVTENEEEKGLPEGVIPLFLASKTQEIFECRTDEDVTDDEPYKFIKKEKILEDLFNRAAISDFSVIKKIIQDYAGDEILIVYDPDFKYGQNFYVATTEEAKNRLLHVEGEEGEEGEAGEDIVYKYVPPESKPWVSLGSEKEIEEASFGEHRKRLKMCIQRKRSEFGAPCKFTDRNVADAKDAYIECTAYEDKTFELRKLELDKDIQAIPEFTESAAQTDWKYPRNAVCQYEPRVFDDEEKKEWQEKEELVEFVKRVSTKFEVALQQNEIMDVFFDDWENLADEDSSFGSKADNHLKEYQSFTDLQFSKGKTITAIEWHPSIRGIVAVAVAERMSFDDRIDQAAKVIMNPSLILVWSFSDPIHPQLLLEAPDDIMSFKFSPCDPNIICGGCINGQIVLWDISQYAERLKQPRSKRKDTSNTLPGFEDENSMDTPIIRYCAVSSIEQSHRAPVTDILWIPDHFEVNRMGVPQENKLGQCYQIMSCGTDHASVWHQADQRKGKRLSKPKVEMTETSKNSDEPKLEPTRRVLSDAEQAERMPGLVLFWDTRPPKTYGGHEKQKDLMKNPMGVPDTFKHLDLTWKPMLKVNLYKSEPGGDHAPTKFSISERHGDKTNFSDDGDQDKENSANTMAGGFTMGATQTGSAKRTLKNIKTQFYCGTEDGEIVYVDWMPQKDQDTGKLQTPKPDYYHAIMDGPIVTLQRSPFFKDIVLCVGGWTFSLWKEGVTTGSILSSCASSKRLTAGYWSPSRPAVFYITKQDGSVDIWDLLDRTHEPSMNQSVSPAPITSIYPFQVTNKQHLLAVGDNSGTLHILEIPWSLRQPTPNELQGVANYFDREVKRRGFVVERWNFREKEKMEIESENKRKAGIAPQVQLSDEEVEYRMKEEYEKYLKDEHKFLLDLGLIKEEEDEPHLPE
ncbi:hypothetical protein LSH36_196g03010 [Paralvinella palmiformis]|uniref:WD repeat-containing protein 63 n=1 Tax=Paralvinella palmiformis TaxID=53620 RepID=A0AAD9JQN7_9ANNE|nr:hypothetical protein LSH36_196g03010 [Paralvinella palmiformis]